MFVNRECLPHLLEPGAYFDPESRERERKLLTATWHLVGSTVDLARPGDFLTCNLLGTPIQVRNFDGELKALSNVCAHRHSLLTSQERGNSPTMRCQYHGWQYAASGRTRKIPAPENFVPMPERRPCLPSYRLERAGQLLFVNLAAEGPSLAEHLGPLHTLCEARFGPEWESFLSWGPDYAANWKVPVENSLEAYHVPFIHPRTFGEDPGEKRSQHQLEANWTSFKTSLPFAHSRADRWFQLWETRVVRQLGGTTSGEYWQYHVFPNLLFSFTDAVSLCQCVIPTGVSTCRAVVRQFGLVGEGWRQSVGRGWGRLKAAITRRILEEDRGIFASIQAGLEASPHAGILGRCEERIHAFQQFMQKSTRVPD